MVLVWESASCQTSERPSQDAKDCIQSVVTSILLQGELFIDHLGGWSMAEEEEGRKQEKQGRGKRGKHNNFY